MNLNNLLIKNLYKCVRIRNTCFSTCMNRNESSYLKDLRRKSFSFSNIFTLNRSLKTSSINKRVKQTQAPRSGIDEYKSDNDPLEDNEYESLYRSNASNIAGVSTVAVLQPWIKWGSRKRHSTSRDLLLDEACALVNSIPSVSIVYKEAVNLQVIKKGEIFTSGTLERLITQIGQIKPQALFVSIDFLTRPQRSALEEAFGVKVLDRYTVVLGIFKHYAMTLEARLQIAMAELPFMRKVKLSDAERVIVDRRETRLKVAVKNIADRRLTIRKTRQKANIPSVAIVGYTNCGKTTLIRSLTGDKNIVGANRLFATLDVTAHMTRLPCGISVLLVDTVGFIQDIPEGLLASFKATLMDTVYSDVIVHLRDISHPDLVGQTATVQDTLQSIDIPESTPIVTVNNKSDLVVDNPEKECLNISAISGQGLNDLLVEVEGRVLQATGRKKYRMRLLTGSDEISWLRKNAGISQLTTCPKDAQYTTLIAVMNEVEISQYMKSFRPNR